MNEPTTDLQAAQKALDASLRIARQQQSAHQGAVVAIRDSQTLRLQVLHDELVPVVKARHETSDFIELSLIQSDVTKLWLDLTSYVTMAPDPRTYRLVQDTREGPKTLFETKIRAEMHAKVVEFIAHRTVIRQREMPQTVENAQPSQGRYSTAALILAWLTGFSFGVLVLFVARELLQ